MSEPFVGEIRLFGFSRVPTGWLACNGQSLSVATYSALYAVIGNAYGGGSSSFNAPDLQGRVAIGQGQIAGQPNYVIGQNAGQEAHTLTEQEMPTHSHALMSTTNVGTTVTPGSTVHLATASAGTLYAPVANAAPYSTMAPCLSSAGEGVPHDNMMPSLVCNYCICFEGIFPSQG